MDTATYRGRRDFCQKPATTATSYILKDLKLPQNLPQTCHKPSFRTESCKDTKGRVSPQSLTKGSGWSFPTSYRHSQGDGFPASYRLIPTIEPKDHGADYAASYDKKVFLDFSKFLGKSQDVSFAVFYRVSDSVCSVKAKNLKVKLSLFYSLMVRRVA